MPIILVLAIVLLSGLFLTRVVKLFNLPNVTGYLIAGILIGPYCFNILTHESLEGLKIFIPIALGFIAFSIGGEFKFKNIKAIGSKIVVITIFQATAAVVLVIIGLIIFKVPIALALILGAIATATAPAATLLVIRQYKAQGPVTDALLPVVAFDDALGLIIYALLFSIAETIVNNEGLSVVNTVLFPLAEIFFSIIVGALIGLILVFGTKWFRSRANRLILMITAVLAGVGLCEFISTFTPFEMSSLLACMSMGIIFCNLRNRSTEILEGLERWTPPIFMLFFVVSSAELNFTLIPTVGVIGVVYIICRSIGKYFGTYFGASITNSDPKIKKYLGLGLLPQAGVAIGMAQLASASLPIYASKIMTVVLCATLFYELVGPVITKIALTKAGEIQSEKKNIPTDPVKTE